MQKRKILITSALPYINGIKHLGNLIGSMLPADVAVRFHRLRGHDAIYICATDEHGTPAELAALEEKIPVKQYCDIYYAKQLEIYEKFGLSFDHFGRTSKSENHQVTQELFRSLEDNGHISEGEIKQQYCLNCERFLPDRYLTGQCPNCGYDRARGDQCENCTQVLNPIEIIDPQCMICNQKNVEIRSSLHLFLELPNLDSKVREWLGYDEKIGKVMGKPQWPSTTRGIAEHWLKMGLLKRCITRDLSWGIKVPKAGYEDKVFYVWFDAPIGYIGATMEWAQKIGKPDAWKDYWYSEETEYIQTMAKDNVPFHSISFPATLLGAGTGIHLVDRLKSFEWLNYEGGKFSTSQKRGVFLDQAIELYPADYWRFYLLSIAPERHDTDFAWDEFQQVVNSDLNDGLGNLIMRILKMCNSEFLGENPPRGELEEEDKVLLQAINEGADAVATEMEELELQKALRMAMEVVRAGNRYINQKAPWRDLKENKARAGTTISLGIRLLRSLAILMEPFIPFTVEKIWAALNLEGSVHKQNWDSIKDDCIPEGHSISGDIPRCFSKIGDKQKKEHKMMFAGIQVDKVDTKVKSKKKKRGYEGLVSFEQFRNNILKVAKIINAEDIAESEKLIKLEIDVGDEKNRIIVAGIRPYYSKEDLIGRRIVIITNLEPKEMFGIKGEGMLLAADVNGVPFLLNVDGDPPPGSIIT